MEFIWQSVDKEPDGSVCYPPEMVDFLWDYGFVDTLKISKETWRQAFEPFKQKEGHYKLTRDAFLSLDKYRYDGEIRIPFDAMRINEGKYTDEGFGQLVGESVAPSCALESADLQQFVENLKKEFRQPDDLILIKAPAKLKIRKLLDDNPSPLRHLELMFDEMLKKRGIAQEIDEGLEKIAATATPEQRAKLQASAFAMGPTSLAESQSVKLKQMTQAKPAETTPPPDTSGEPLKNIKRTKKGLRG